MANASNINIIGVGARTPLGLQAPAAAASVRAAISALGDHPFMVDQVGDPMPAAMDPELDPRLIGPSRFLKLATPAQAEACAPLAKLGSVGMRLPVYLGLPEIRPGFTEKDLETIRAGVAAFDGLPVRLGQVTPFPVGHAAGAVALQAAIAPMRQGALDLCLVGGVESYFHPDTMEWLDANRQLAGTVSRSGFVPGEGAAFILLASDAFCKRFQQSCLATVDTVCLASETKLIKTDEVCVGEGLTKAVEGAVANLLGGTRINKVICDINGERYRGEEWGFVCLRLSQHFDDPTAYQSPADCWGDMGAASIPLFAMLASEGIARGYAQGPRILLWAGSEKGQRGAVVLKAFDKV